MGRFDSAGEAFRRALDEADRDMPAATDASPPLPRSNAPASVDFGPGRGGGGEARWDFAMQWTNESVPPLTRPASGPACEPEASRPETAAAIAQELGLGTEMSPRQLAARWRDFVWRNHPDRQPGHARDRASARVAIANALYDNARREMTKIR
jgi:hypothetical protein